MTTADDGLLPSEELTADDLGALRWAVSADHPHRAAIASRARVDQSKVVTANELSDIRSDWEAAGRPAPERHVHRDPVAFPGGAVVTAVTFLGAKAYERDVAPRFGLYLDERWEPPWDHAKVDWPDFGLPADAAALRVALQDLLDRAKGDAPVEVGCLGGHGRTGTALACLAVLAGIPAADAVEWVRSNYCPRAVETDDQEAFVRAFADHA